MTAFWILTTTVLCLGIGVVSWALGVKASWGWAATGLTVLLPGAVWTPWFEIGIRAWNKGVRLTVPLVRAYVLKVSYWVLISSVGRASSTLDLSLGSTDRSRWIPRGPRRDEIGGDGPFPRHQPASGLVAWAWCRGKTWRLSLLPVMLLLTLLGDEAEQSGPPTGTYTLY